MAIPPPAYCVTCRINLWENPGVLLVSTRAAVPGAPLDLALACDCGAPTVHAVVSRREAEDWALTQLARQGPSAAQALARLTQAGPGATASLQAFGAATQAFGAAVQADLEAQVADLFARMGLPTTPRP